MFMLIRFLLTAVFNTIGFHYRTGRILFASSLISNQLSPIQTSTLLNRSTKSTIAKRWWEIHTWRSNSVPKCVITIPNNKHHHYLDACTPEVVLETELLPPRASHTTELSNKLKWQRRQETSQTDLRRRSRIKYQATTLSAFGWTFSVQ